MLLGSTDRTSTIAWSPSVSVSSISTPLLAAATVAGALDASFSTSTTLELLDPLNDFKVLGSVSAAARFNRLAWGPSPDPVKRPMGILAGGLENGEMALWDPRIILDNYSNKASHDPFIMKPVKHKGPVKGLDFNPVDSKFLASGAADGELFIWDLTNPSKPYSPGARSTRLEDVTAVSWNRLYHYILASASNNGSTVIWDLRNRQEIAAFSHPYGRKQISSLAWNPDSPTQIATASDDDTAPVILMWDLRNSRAPEKVLTGHSKGVLNLSWCPKDSSLLLSCGKDNRTIVWDPSSGPEGKVIGDLHRSRNWSFEAQWCHRNPDLIAVAGFDGTISVHSLQGSGKSDDGTAAAAAIEAEVQASLSQDPHAFITGGGFGSLQPQPQTTQVVDSKFSLPHAPKWLRRPVGASWGFGNRLVRFSNARLPDGTSRHTVSIRPVVSEPAFVNRAAELERVDSTGAIQEFITYCQSMAQSDGGAVISEKDRELWRFLGVMFETGSREQVLQFLGFDKAEVAGTEKLAALLKKLLISTEVQQEEQVEGVPAAVQDQYHGDANGEGAVEGDDFTLIAAQNKAAPPAPAPAPAVPFKLYSSIPGESSDTDALITKALVLGNFETAVRICFGANRLADALVFAISGGSELMAYAQAEYFKRLRNEKSYIRVLNDVVQGNLVDIVENAQIDGGDADWKDLLALICTYGRTEELAGLFSALGRRLEAIATAPASAASLKTIDWKAREEKKFGAVLCYLVAGDLTKVLNIWALRESEEEKLLKTVKNAKTLLTSTKSSHTLALQSLIEKVHVFRQAIEFVDVELVHGVQDPNATHYSLDTLYQRYVEYAQIAANQGLLSVAWKTLQMVPEGYQIPKADPVAVEILKDRLYNSGLVRDAVGQQPAFPFEFVDIAKPVVPAPVPVAQTYSQYGQQQYGQQTQQQYGNQTQYQTPAVPQGLGRYPSSSGQYGATGANQYGQYPQVSPYGGATSAYGQPQAQTQQYGYNPQPAAPPRSTFAPPPPPAVNTGLPAQPYGASNQYAPPLPPSAQTYGAQSNQYGNTYNSAPAPPPAASGFVPPPAVAGRSVSQSGQYIAPQPQMLGQTGPSNSFAGFPAPAPSASVPPQPTAAPAPAAATGPKRHPSGDRTHIKPAHLPIVTGLDAVMNVCKETKTQPQQKREWEDTEKKVLNLFDQLNNGEVAEDIVAKLLSLVKYLQSGDYSAAHKLQVELLTAKFSATSAWILGVKRVIDTLERAELDKQQAHQQPLPATAAPPPSAYATQLPRANQLPPPPAATASPYGNAPPAATNPYGNVPPPAAKPYGSAPPPSANQYNNVAPPPAANQYQQAPPPPAASAPYGSTNIPPPPAAGTSPYGAAPPPSARGVFSPQQTPSQPYGGVAPPPAATAPYGGAAAPPPPAASNPYGRPPVAAMPPPPAASNPYGGAPPPAASNPYGGNQQYGY
ncbi:protein transport protein S31 [Rhizoclosmatium sp. JEL0117]|nr:protein transport protein S31 [Rhizoclosmatium sp. JEL0117]